MTDKNKSEKKIFEDYPRKDKRFLPIQHKALIYRLWTMIHGLSSYNVRDVYLRMGVDESDIPSDRTIRRYFNEFYFQHYPKDKYNKNQKRKNLEGEFRIVRKKTLLNYLADTHNLYQEYLVTPTDEELKKGFKEKKI